MKDKTKAILCLVGMVVVLLLGIIFNTDATMGWFAIMALGFGWYARGAIISDAKGRVSE